jgi:predicted DNA-binding protein (MmcQ/YjbR family)
VTHDRSQAKPDIIRAEAAVAALALRYPEATEDNPWGHRAFKVKGKTFLFTSSDGTGLGISVKLPESGVLALELPFAEPTGYGLGKSGWVSARWKAGKDVPVSLVGEWLAESYRAIAPKKLSALVGAAPALPPAAKPAKEKKASRAGTRSAPPTKARKKRPAAPPKARKKRRAR